MKNTKENNFNLSKNRIIIFSIILLFIFSTIFFAKKIENFINYTTDDNYETVLNNNFKIHYIDVGQGDCICVELPNKKIMLIDSGTLDSKNIVLNYLNKYVLKDNNLIDYFVITHPHIDHTGGAVTILQNFEIKNIYRPNIYCNSENIAKEFGELPVVDTDQYEELITNINNETYQNSKSNVYFNSCFIEIEEDNYKIEFLSPNSNTYDNLNNYSPIILLTIDNKKFMFTGDAEDEVEQEVMMLNNSYLEYLDIDVLKVAHHGSNSSTKQNFLEILKPEYAIISVGVDNDYNNPNSSVLERLTSIGVKNIYRTDICGNIVLTCLNNNIIATCFKQNFPVYIHYSYVLICCIVLNCCVCLLSNKSDQEKV